MIFLENHDMIRYERKAEWSA